MENIIIIAFGMFFTGFIDAIAGGGGIIAVPLLMWSGLPIKVAIATNKVGGIVGNSTTTYNYYKKGIINKKIVLLCIPSAFIGAIIGSQLLKYIPSDKLEKGIPYVLISLVIYMLLSKNLGHETKHINHDLKHKITIIASVFIVGIYNGFFGPASGSFLTISLVSIYGLSFLEGTATSKPINLVMIASSIITFILAGSINIKIGLVCAIFRSLGARLGSNYAVNLKPKTMKFIFITITTIIVIKMLFFK